MRKWGQKEGGGPGEGLVSLGVARARGRSDLRRARGPPALSATVADRARPGLPSSDRVSLEANCTAATGRQLQGEGFT
eukprot:766764-Hanusia_phi.AAC.1